jgi:hypothetical protein
MEIKSMKQTAAELGISYIMLWRAAHDGSIPVPQQMGRYHYFQAEDIKWLKHFFSQRNGHENGVKK